MNKSRNDAIRDALGSRTHERGPRIWDEPTFTLPEFVDERARVCTRCRVEFEPKTPKLTSDQLQRFYYHVGCWQIKQRAEDN